MKSFPRSCVALHTARFSANRDVLTAAVDGNDLARDLSFSRGRAGLMAYRVGADCDNVHFVVDQP